MPINGNSAANNANFQHDFYSLKSHCNELKSNRNTHQNFLYHSLLKKKNHKNPLPNQLLALENRENVNSLKQRYKQWQLKIQILLRFILKTSSSETDYLNQPSALQHKTLRRTITDYWFVELSPRQRVKQGGWSGGAPLRRKTVEIIELSYNEGWTRDHGDLQGYPRHY